jgi:hypothetical protein
VLEFLRCGAKIVFLKSYFKDEENVR